MNGFLVEAAAVIIAYVIWEGAAAGVVFPAVAGI
jgi:hypothetical protein